MNHIEELEEQIKYLDNKIKKLEEIQQITLKLIRGEVLDDYLR